MIQIKNKEVVKGKLKTIGVIETELGKRLERMRKSNINMQIAIVNDDTKALGTIASVYSKSIEENLKMLKTLEKLLVEINNLIDSE